MVGSVCEGVLCQPNKSLETIPPLHRIIYSVSPILCVYFGFSCKIPTEEMGYSMAKRVSKA